MTKLYFPNLNGLRFIAALLVLIHHTEQLKSLFHIDSNFSNPCVFLIGKLGVVLFFVLSGFLITFLLLKEKDSTLDISIRQFYIRRILRIWPLYYLILSLGFFILPSIKFFIFPGLSATLSDHFFYKLDFYIFFLPNVSFVLFPIVPFISQAWSVGVEEQFYLIWPILLKKCKNVFNVLIAVIIIYMLIRASLLLYIRVHPDNITIKNLSLFWGVFNIDCMAIGGLGALILFHKKEKYLNVIFNRYFQIVVYTVVSILILKGYRAPTVIHYELYAVFFIIIILNLAENADSVVNLEYKWLNYLGKISYGIYMYHAISIFIILKVFSSSLGNNNWIIYPLVILLTTTLASLSYSLIEAKFINLKRRFSVIQSGEKD